MEKKKKKRHWLLYHFPPEEKEKGKKTHVRQGNSRKWGNRYYYIKVGFGVFIWQSRWVWENPSNALGTGCVERSPDSFRVLVSPLEAESESDEEFLGKGGKRRKKGILRVFWACTIRVAHRTASFPLFSFFFARNFRVKLKGKGRSFSAPKIWRKTWETNSFLLGNIYNSWSDELAIHVQRYHGTQVLFSHVLVCESSMPCTCPSVMAFGRPIFHPWAAQCCVANRATPSREEKTRSWARRRRRRRTQFSTEADSTTFSNHFLAI